MWGMEWETRSALTYHGGNDGSMMYSLYLQTSGSWVEKRKDAEGKEYEADLVEEFFASPDLR